MKLLAFPAFEVRASRALLAIFKILYNPETG
jgi:hypothetical protein